MNHARSRVITLAALTALALGVPAAADTDRPIYVRPGAPGEPTQRISPDELFTGGDYRYSEAEVTFMQMMLVHHGQAVIMSDWAREGRADSERLLRFADRIGAAQDSEIALMARWLDLRGEEVPDPEAHEQHEMPGLLTPQEMDELEEAEGREFDELFLEGMIFHHRGGIEMARTLRRESGGVLDATVSTLSLEVIDVQDTEIQLMQALLDDLRD